MKQLLCVLFIWVYGCLPKRQATTRLVVNDVARDTTFFVKKTPDSHTAYITLSTSGILDDSASVILVNPRQPELAKYTIIYLPGGRIDIVSRMFDYYDEDVQIHYHARRVKRGKLTLIVKY